MGIRYDKDTYVQRNDPYSYGSPKDQTGEIQDPNFISAEQNELYSININSLDITNTNLSTIATESGVITSLVMSITMLDASDKRKNYDCLINGKTIYTYSISYISPDSSSYNEVIDLPNIKINAGDVFLIQRSGDAVAIDLLDQDFTIVGYKV